jgi:hypothetical protein
LGICETSCRVANRWVVVVVVVVVVVIVVVVVVIVVVVVVVAYLEVFLAGFPSNMVVVHVEMRVVVRLVESGIGVLVGIQEVKRGGSGLDIVLSVI